MKLKRVYSVFALFVMCNQSGAAAEEEEQSDFSARDVKPFIVLEYKPIISFYHPVPFTLGQLVPAGTPWPDSPEGYKTTLRPEPPPSLVNKIGKEGVEPVTVSEYIWMKPSSPASTQKLSQNNTTTVNPTKPWPTSTTHTKVKPASNLDYKPTKPPYLPDVPTIGQLIPSGTPWPESPEGSQTIIEPTSTKVKPATVLEYKPTRPSFLPEPTIVGQLIPSGTPWLDSPQGYTTTLKPPLENKFGMDNNAKPATVLEYKPTRPSFLPEPSTIGQLIPPGKPWPASVDEDTTSSSQTTNRFPEVTINKEPAIHLTQQASSKSSSPTTHIILGYKPQRPWYVPDPVTIGQIVPPGKPWPASVDEYTTPPSQITTRFPEVTSKKPAIRPTQPTSSKSSSSRTTHIVLGYKPTRPWYVPDPVTIGQIVPSGEPWPASAEGYINFSATNRFQNRIQDVTNSLS